MADEMDMMTYLTIVLALAIAPPAGFDPTPILDAIEKVETGGQRDSANAIGDGGKALGPMQIHRVYWVDAVDHDPSLVANGETYDSVRDRAYARRVVMAYWSRYAKSWDAQTLARIHNGGPKGHVRKATLGYWAKVKAKLGA
jgi:hypothetical protein